MKKFLKVLIADLNEKETNEKWRNIMQLMAIGLIALGSMALLSNHPSSVTPKSWEGALALTAGVLCLLGSGVTITRKKKDISKNEDKSE